MIKGVMMNKRKRSGLSSLSRWLLCVAMMLGVSALGTARASIMLALDLPELVRQAEHIAVVDVVSVKTTWDDAHERIYSMIDLKVVESWKTSVPGSDAPGDHLTVVQLGGTVGDISMTVTGLGSFLPGERSLVFLRGPANHTQVVGMTQGKRPLRYHAATRQWLVAPPNLSQAKLVRPVTPSTAKPLTALTPATPAIPTTPASPSAPVTPSTSAPLPAGTSTGALVPKEMMLSDLRAQVQRLVGTSLP